MKRLKMLDYSRGFAILSMMFFHSFQFYEGDLNQIASDMSSNPISKVFRFFGRWAGLFVIISGFAFAYVTYSRLFEGIIKPKPMIKQTVSFGSALIIVEKVINFFFHRTNRGGGIYGFNEGPYHYSLILGSLETGKLQIPDLYSAIFSMGAVTAIGLSLIFLSLIVGGLYHNKEDSQVKLSRHFYVLSLIGTVFVLYSGYFVDILRPKWVKCLENQNYVGGFILGIFVGDTHALFPLFGYACYGAVFGLAMSRNISRKRVVTIGFIAGLFYIIFGGVLYAELGEPPLEQMYRTTPVQTTYLQIGLMIWIMCLDYWIDIRHNAEEIKSKVKPKYFWGMLDRFSLLSLTLYLTEGAVGSLIKILLLDPLFPGWAKSMVWIVIYDIALINLWNIAIKRWKKHDLKYSIEYFLKKSK